MNLSFRSLLLPALYAQAILWSSALVATPSSQELLKIDSQELLQSAHLSQSPFAKAFLQSSDWQHAFFDSGEIKNPKQSIQTLASIWKSYPALKSHRIERDMATACALESPANQAVARFTFFRKKYQKGELNTIFNALTVFERRFLAKGVQHTNFNTIASMEYLNTEVRLPVRGYLEACWYPHYLLENPFGDSIHGPLYYRPFSESWASYAEIVREVGGVCGSLSNFGAAAAISNGIPAVTMGEPGHCSYAIMTQHNQWTPSYSLSWSRGLHTAFYDKYSWSGHLYNALSQDTPHNAWASGDLRRKARFFAKKHDFTSAEATMHEARTTYPYDWKNWTLSARILNESKAPQTAWNTLQQDVIDSLAPKNPEAADLFLQQDVFSHTIAQPNQSFEQKKKVLIDFHKAMTKQWQPARWSLDKTIASQLKNLGGNSLQQDDFLAELFSIHASSKEISPVVLETSLKLLGHSSQRKQHFIAAMGKLISSDNGQSGNDIIDTLASKILPDAAQRGDKETFQYIGKLTAPNYPALGINPEPFPGILLSSGGTFSIQAPGNQWDKPSRHWGVIEEHGGDFHTDTKPAQPTVQLGNYGRLSGVVLVARNGNLWRMKGAQLQTSMDGKNWTMCAKLTEQRIQRIDLSQQHIDASYVRIFQPNQPHLHFHKILVYGFKKN